MREIGSVQLGFLKSLVQSGPYQRGGGWVWGSHSLSIRIAKSLLNRGLVMVIPERGKFGLYDRYYITEEGKKTIHDHYTRP